MNKTFYPIDNKIIIKLTKTENLSSGGVIIPDTAAEKLSLGEVIAIGPGLVTINGDRLQMQCKVGDMVIFPKYELRKFEYLDIEYATIKESELITIVKNEKEIIENLNL